MVEVEAAIAHCTGVRADQPFLAEFRRMWLEAAPRATAGQVIAAVRAKWRGSRRKDNPLAHLRTSVINALTANESPPAAPPREEIVWLTQDELAEREGGE